MIESQSFTFADAIKDLTHTGRSHPGKHHTPSLKKPVFSFENHRFLLTSGMISHLFVEKVIPRRDDKNIDE